jgi:hypothetical protein
MTAHSAPTCAHASGTAKREPQSASGGERWRPVPGYEDYYEVSDLGRVRTVARVCYRSDGRPQRVKARIKRATAAVRRSGAGNYLSVILKVDGIEKRCYVHNLVLRAFDRLPLPGEQSRHRNGIKEDNRLSNLHWGTHKDNAVDRIEHGTHPIGSRNGFARLTEADVPHIRAARAAGATVQAIARQYGVNRETIGHLLRGDTWRHA